MPVVRSRPQGATDGRVIFGHVDDTAKATLEYMLIAVPMRMVFEVHRPAAGGALRVHVAHSLTK